MIRQYKLKDDTLYIEEETSGLMVLWILTSKEEYGVFLVADEKGIDILIPESENEIFSKIKSKNEIVRPQTIELELDNYEQFSEILEKISLKIKIN